MSARIDASSANWAALTGCSFIDVDLGLKLAGPVSEPFDDVWRPLLVAIRQKNAEFGRRRVLPVRVYADGSFLVHLQEYGS
jgi:hypothetical protein